MNLTEGLSPMFYEWELVKKFKDLNSVTLQCIPTQQYHLDITSVIICMQLQCIAFHEELQEAI